MRIVHWQLLLFTLAVATGVSAVALAQSGGAGRTNDNGQKSNSVLRAGLILAELSDLAECLVVDPSSTPLNIRTAPQGPITGTIPNGQPVRIIRQTKDSRGEPWAYIADATSRPLGWVFRDYLVCR